MTPKLRHTEKHNALYKINLMEGWWKIKIVNIIHIYVLYMFYDIKLWQIRGEWWLNLNIALSRLKIFKTHNI